MHRSFNLLILFLIATSLIACSSSPTTASTTTPTPTDTPDMAATNVAHAQATQDAASPYATSSTNTGYTPPPTPKWTTTHTFRGNGSKKTAIFHVPDDWKILYTCTHQEMDVEGVLGVVIYSADNTIIDVAVNATCKPNVNLTKGETEEHQAGDIYLDIEGTGDWSVSIQELK